MARRIASYQHHLIQKLLPINCSRSRVTLFSLPDVFKLSCPSLQLHTSRIMESGNPESLAIHKPVVGVIQMNSGADKDANFAQASALIKRAKSMGAEMVFLPECFDLITESRAETFANSETIAGTIIGRYKELAKEARLWISLGGFHEKPGINTESQDGRIHNSHLIVNCEGDLVGHYSKTHLFDVEIKDRVRLKESDSTYPGQKIVPPVATPVGKVGLSICYDLRFPEISRLLTHQGAEILTYPSAFTVPTGMAHWHTLLKGRAIENQCYVIAAAQVGKHNAKRSSYGHSLIVDPWGCILAECQDTPDVAVAQIDLEYLRRRRLEMPVWEHRRSDLYGHIQPLMHEGSQIDIDVQPAYQFGQVSVKSSQVFHRSSHSYAFVNRKPVLPGHVLVASLREVPKLVNLSAAEVADLFQCVQHVSSRIQDHYGATSLTIAVQDGPDAGQTIQHVHVHILPRKPGDFEKNDDVYDKLEKHDKDVPSNKWRTDEDMVSEAAALRTLFQ